MIAIRRNFLRRDTSFTRLDAGSKARIARVGGYRLVCGGLGGENRMLTGGLRSGQSGSGVPSAFWLVAAVSPSCL